MRVLLPIIYHELTHCVKRAFEDAGHEVLVVNWRKFGNRKHLVEPHCIEQAQVFKPDLCFAQFQAPGLITSQFPLTLKELGCFTVNWSGDVRAPLPQWYIDVAPHFDVTAFTNWDDVHAIGELGHRAEFLQIGYDELIYHSQDQHPREGVVFVGNNYGDRYPEGPTRRAMVEALAEAFGSAFTVHGMGWPGGAYVREPGDAAIYRRALVAVGWDHFIRPGFASDRLLRATACGCATINQHYDGIADEHPYVGAAKSIEEVVKMVAHALKHSEEARKIGELSAANTLQQHRWNERVKTVMTWM